jgi:hypothetical protein
VLFYGEQSATLQFLPGTAGSVLPPYSITVYTLTPR